jgi:hypothetical protein
MRKEDEMFKFCAANLILGLILSGCSEVLFAPDVTPPAPPQGLSSATGDGLVELIWNDNTEPDLAGYRIYASSSYEGPYERIGSSIAPSFIDKGIPNGKTYYYAVAAYDGHGNESELSHDIIYDTPRPEGYDVALRNYLVEPGRAGYDFSTYSIGPYDDLYTDVFFELYNGVFYLNVWDDSEIQDVGYTRSLYDVGYAPVTGWNPTKDALLVLGHTYVVRTWDRHYAKLRVNAISGDQLLFDWAYQLQTENNRLKQASAPSRHLMSEGPGAAGRR